jgi:hypothetical protein
MGITGMKRSCDTCRYRDNDENQPPCWSCTGYDTLPKWTPNKSDMGHDDYEKWLEDTWKAIEANHKTLENTFKHLAKMVKERS